MSYYQNLGLQYLPDGCRPCASVKVGDLVQTKFVFQDAAHALVFWFEVMFSAPDHYVANTALNACCVAAYDLGVKPDDITALRANMERERAKLLTADTPYKLKDQP